MKKIQNISVSDFSAKLSYTLKHGSVGGSFLKRRNKNLRN
jgi:hypothetical protein